MHEHDIKRNDNNNATTKKKKEMEQNEMTKIAEYNPNSKWYEETA